VTVLLSVLGFLAVLGPLVIVHELGHFIFARLFGVKAEVFSVGFGPKLWSRQGRETELRISAIPLGGYVKLLGEDPNEKQPLPPELQKRTLQAQKPWKRFFIFFGGPLFNFLFAIVVFMAILVIGEPQAANVIGRVIEGSPAALAGLRSGDRVLEVNGRAVNRYEEILQLVGDHPNQDIRLKIVRRNAAEATDVTIKTGTQEGFSIYGESTQVGEIAGIIPFPRAAVVGISNPNSLAAKAGLKTGEHITALNGAKVENWERMEEMLRAVVPGQSVKLELKEKTVTLHKPAASVSPAEDWGLYSSELFVERTLEKAPAEVAGIKAGDRIISVGGKPVRSFYDLKDAVQMAGETSGKVVVQWEHEGAVKTASIEPTATSGRDPLLKKTMQYTIGIAPKLMLEEPVMMTERVLNPFLLVGKATERMVVLTWRNLVSLKKMITGDVSVATLGGPILIGKIAGESIARGLIAFLTTMAVLSVGLGILNVLPIPVLDGGHLLLLGVETVRKRPLSLRQMEIVQQIGLSLILLLMVIVMKNDITRLPIFN
jgi:regulator of sigma E protease